MTKNTALFPCKPNFLGIGVAKAGTTTIASLLGQHPEISFPISDQKELHYFDEKYTKHSVNWYLNQFHSNIAVGEFTPSYLFVPEVRDRIYHELGPSTKFIVALRNPVDRAFAHYSHAVNNWFEKRYKDLGYPTEVLGFEAALQQEHLRLASNEFHIRHLSYFSKGLYARQLKWYFQVFDQKNFYVYLLEEYIHTPQKVLRDLCEFLGVDSRLEFTGINKKLNSQTNLALDPLIRSKLTKKYEESIRELEVLLGRDLSVWRDMDEKKEVYSFQKTLLAIR